MKGKQGKKGRGEMLNMYILVALLLVEILVFSILSDYFLTIKNIFAIGLNIAVLGIVAIGQTLCILTSDFDLSVGGAAAFTGIMMGFFFPENGVFLFAGVYSGNAGGLSDWIYKRCFDN